MSQLLGIFSFLVVLLRAAILGCQTVAVGGISFLLIATHGKNLRSEALLNSAWKLIRRSALALALAQLFFIVTNSLVLTASADIPLREVFGANFVLAGALAVFAGLALYLWPKTLRETVSPIALVPAILIIASSVLTSHAASRMDDR